MVAAALPPRQTCAAELNLAVNGDLLFRINTWRKWLQWLVIFSQMQGATTVDMKTHLGSSPGVRFPNQGQGSIQSCRLSSDQVTRNAAQSRNCDVFPTCAHRPHWAAANTRRISRFQPLPSMLPLWYPRAQPLLAPVLIHVHCQCCFIFRVHFKTSLSTQAYDTGCSVASHC